jgi:beta-glucosidase-like glycosyl hydrolase/CubicO group peptidase (beta-lactamase class C family)
MIRTLFAALLLSLSFQNAASQPFSTSGPAPAAVDSLLNTLSLRQRIGQLFVTFANGEFYGTQSEEFAALHRKITVDGVGGIIFSTGGILDQAMLNNRLQSAATIPLLISQDMEYGPAMRIRGTSRLTPAMGIAATGKPENAFLAGQITAREAKAIGVHQIYAPAADINNNPKNPIINVRSFGEDPNQVGTFATAFMKGVLSEGLIPTAKHFPGHGDTDVDSHVELPVIRHSWKRLDTLELVPFRRLIAEGLPSMMSAHISFPNMSANPATPGTLDPNVLKRILLDSLRFKGVVITDALTMEAVTKQFSPGKAARMALEAGADILLMSTDETSAIDELEKAVQNGTLSEERILFSVRKILTWKHQLGLFKNRMANVDALPGIIVQSGHQLNAQRIARESVTLLKNNGGIVPVTSGKAPKLMVIAIADDESGNAGRVLVREIRKYHPDVSFGLFDARTSTEEREQILKKAAASDLIIIGAYIFVRMEGKIQFNAQQADFVAKLNAFKKPQAVIAFGNPYIVSAFPNADVHLCAWSNAAEQVEQTVPALFGASAISGKLPVTIPGFYARGFGMQLPQSAIRTELPAGAGINREKLRAVDAIVEQAIRDSVFPGAQVAIVKDGLLIMNRGFGYHTYEKQQAVKSSDLYDLASITKIMATVPAIMMLVDQGTLKLNAHVSDFFPEWKDGEKKKVTIRNLLEHNSGLPAFRVYVDSLKTADQIRTAVINEPLIEKPGTKVIYSDLGFILLGLIVEKITGQPLDLYLNKTLYEPAGWYNTRFKPASGRQAVISRTVPTENDTLFRKKLLRGEVHDERAFALNGVSGHAGLFADASDVAAYAQLLLNGGSYAGQSFIKPETVKLFATKSGKNATRALGFDLKKEAGSSAGTLMSDRTFGHTGFTGTSVWIDPERNLAVVMLTNRVHPHRSYGAAISQIRASVADATVKALEKP